MNARTAPTTEQIAVTDEFNAILDSAHEFEWSDQLNCYGYPERYVDYSASHVPTPERAEWLCEGCPMLALCDEFARKTKPAWGVWGGKVYQHSSLRVRSSGDKRSAIQKAN